MWQKTNAKQTNKNQNRLRIYESHIFELRIKTWMKVIPAVMCTTWAVVKIRPARIIFIHVFIRSSNIWLSYILNRLFITSRVYLEPTLWPPPSWLISSIGRALPSIAEVMGSNPVQTWIFSRPYFHYCLSSVPYCEDHFHSQESKSFNFVTIEQLHS